MHRVIDGSDKYYVEKMSTQFKGLTTRDARFLDAFSIYEGEPTSTISNLDYMENEMVDILADGAVHPSLTVVDGSIELNKQYSSVVVGQNFVSEVWPNLADISTAEGSVLGRMERVTNLDINFYQTVGAVVGRWDSEDGATEEEVPFRVPADLAGQPVPLFSGMYHYGFQEGFDRSVDYYIKQIQPLPLTVRSVTDSIEVYE